MLEEYTWLIVFCSLASFFVSWGIGANDVANAFGTSVGSKVLTVKQAIFAAAIFEFCGSAFMGASVTSTIKGGIVNPASFTPDENGMFLTGMFSVLMATGVWLVLATKYGLPVSTTHSVIGALLGFGLVAKGVDGVKWTEIIKIVVSWFASPVLAGLIALVIFASSRSVILRKSDPLATGLRCLPFLFGFTIALNVLYIIYKGSPAAGLTIPFWQGVLISIGFGIVATALWWKFGNPWIEKKVHGTRESQSIFERISDYIQNLFSRRHEQLIEEENVENMPQGYGTTQQPSDVETPNPAHHPDPKDSESFGHDHSENFDAKAEKLFNVLQVFTACFSAFAHGANDVANGIGPFAAAYAVYETGLVTSKSEVPIWILIMGGVGLVAGLAMWGHKVIATIAHNLTTITPTRGFAMEMATAISVLLASELGIPVSSTHCKVGAVISVGAADGRASVNWKMFAGIAGSWFVTLPATGLMCAGLFALLHYAP